MSKLADTKQRYADGAKQQEKKLCCPIGYDPKFLEVIPSEVIERDYGCGDPSKYVKEGEVVLDLGSGGGKICFIASQIVGPKGKIIGVDMTDEMLNLAKNSQKIVEDKIGYKNIEFKHGYIQDLKTDLDLVDNYLQDHPINNVVDYKSFIEHLEDFKKTEPLIQNNSIDVIVSNCVLNLVIDEQKLQLFREMYRVLKPGGRIAISDIVSDKESPEHLKNDPELWSGCISGAMQQDEFIKALEQVGFCKIKIEKLEEKPWQIVEGIEYRSMTVVAYK